MDEATDLAKKIGGKQQKQRGAIARGAEKLERAREKARHAREAAKRPRDRHADKGRLAAAIREISKDLTACEKIVAAMRKRCDEMEDMRLARNDLLLRDCLRMSAVIDRGRLFEEVNRVRSLSEPIGGDSWHTALPKWVPGEY